MAYPFPPQGRLGIIPTLTYQTPPQSGETTLYINPGSLLLVQTASGGAQVTYYGINDRVVTTFVNEAPADIATECGLVEITATIGTYWVSPANIAMWQEFGSGSLVKVLVFANDTARTLVCSESPADILAAINAANIIAGGGVVSVAAAGTSQGTATSIGTPSGHVVVNITAGTLLQGIRLDDSAVGESRFIVNQSGVAIYVYPFSGDAFVGMSTNTPFILGESQSMLVECGAAGFWGTPETMEVTGEYTAPNTSQAGGTKVLSDRSTVVTCAADGKSMLLNEQFPSVTIANGTANRAKVFCPVGHTLNGVTNGYIWLNVGMVLKVDMTATSTWTAVISKSIAQEVVAATLIANAPRVTASSVFITSVPTNLDNVYVGDPAVGSADVVTEMVVFNQSTTNSAVLNTALTGFVNTNDLGAGTTSTLTLPPRSVWTLTLKYGTGIYYATQSIPSTYKNSGTLVLGAITLDTGAIGAANAARITSSSQFRRNDVSAVNAGTIGTAFLVTITPGVSIVAQAIDATGAPLVTDLSTIDYEIVF